MLRRSLCFTVQRGSRPCGGIAGARPDLWPSARPASYPDRCGPLPGDVLQGTLDEDADELGTVFLVGVVVAVYLDAVGR